MLFCIERICNDARRAKTRFYVPQSVEHCTRLNHFAVRVHRQNPRSEKREGFAVDLKVPIVITDELTEEVITATALLNLASGEIGRIEYQDHDAELLGLPWESDDYEFTSGTLSNAGKDVEFRVDVNKTTGQYSVSASELLEIKVRAAALFAGVTGKDLLSSTAQAQPAAAPRAPGAPGTSGTAGAPGGRPGGRGRFH